MQGIVFCKVGIISEFYKKLAVTLKADQLLRIKPYGAGLSSPRYVQNTLAQLVGEKPHIFLCFDCVVESFQQLSYYDWKGIESDVDAMGYTVNCIAHKDSIEDWLLCDTVGLSNYFGFEIPPTEVENSTSGNNLLKSLFYKANNTYKPTNELFSKKFINSLDIRTIIREKSFELSALLSWINSSRP